VAENPASPILSALAYTTALGYRQTCDFIIFLLMLSWNYATKSKIGLC